jgi:eukaryotic-like serine/threonine-protein kinase
MKDNRATGNQTGICNMTHLWNHLEGVYLAGDYRLDQYLGGAEPAAWYLTMSRSGQRAAIKLIPEDAAPGGQLDAWRAIRLLSHSNLLPLFDCGRAETGEGAVIYAVFEYPDDNLASALAQGPLEPADARETLAAGLEALRYVHGKGMVHGAVDGAHVLAVGDRVKLASDTLLPLAAASVLPQEDVRALHELLGFPYTAPITPPPARAVSVAPAPVVAAPVAPAPVPVAPVAPASVQATTVSPAVEPEPHVAETGIPRSWRAIPNWAFGAAAGLVIAIGLVFAVRPSANSKADAPVPLPAPPPPAAAPSSTPAAAPSVEAAGASPRPSAPQSRPAWRVVAYTYHRYRDAERKAGAINSRWPGLHAAVFAPRGKERPPYFVALGGRMTHSEALNLRQVARAKGLPRDTFVRNYSE